MISVNDKSWVFLRSFTGEILSNMSKSYFRDEVRKDIRTKLADVIKNKDYILHEIGRDVKKDFSPVSVVSDKPLNSFVDSPVIIGKVGPLFKDDVYVIECLGPDKPLIIKSPNNDEVSSITLSEDDIKRVIADFADLARAYPKEGVFNADYKNYSITAIISELAGSRFVITKYLDVKKLISNQ